MIGLHQTGLWQNRQRREYEQDKEQERRWAARETCSNKISSGRKEVDYNSIRSSRSYTTLFTPLHFFWDREPQGSLGT